MKEKTKNSKFLKEFIKYCEQNPKQRFWQALRNWWWTTYDKEAGFILTSTRINFETSEHEGIQDTFYIEDSDYKHGK